MRIPATLFAFLLAIVGTLAQDGTFDPFFNPTDQGMARFDGLHWSHQQGLFPSEGVRAMTVQADGKLLVGGWFPGGLLSIEDPVFRPGIARLNVDGTQDAGFNAGTGFDGPVQTMVVQADGKILVGGAFLNCNGSSRKGIARLNADGSLDAGFTVGTGTGGSVFEIAVQTDGRILLGGNFTTYNALPTNRIVRLLSTGGDDGSFAIGTGFDATVNALAIQVDGKVLVGGLFGSYQGLARNYIARLNTDGSLDVAYVDPASVTGPDGPIADIAIGTAGSAYVVGEFSNFNGSAVNNLVKLDAAGARIPTFGTNAYPNPRVAYDSGSNLLTVWGSGAATSMDKRNGTTGAEVFGFNDFHDDWHFQTSCFHLIMDWPHSTVGPSGEVYRLDAVHTGIMRLNNDLTLDPGFHPGTGLGWFSSNNLGMSMDDFGQVAIGGRIDFKNTFPSLNGTYQPDLLRLSYSGEPDPTFSFPHGFEGSVNGVVALGSDRYLLHGAITLTCSPSSGGYVTTNLLLYDGSTDSFTPMNAPGSCAFPEFGPAIERVIQLASNRVLYVGQDGCSGSFRDVGRFNADGTWDGTYTTTDLGPANELPHCVAEGLDGKIYVGGEFSSANGAVRNRIVRLLSNGGVDPAFDPLGGFNDRVRDMIVNPDGSVVCVGDFTTYRGSPAPHIAKLLPSGAMDPSFNPGTGIANTPLCMLRYPDGRILIGGAIPMYNGTVVNGIVCINANGSIDATFDQGDGFRINNPAINGGTPGGGTVFDMELQPNGQVVCMGEFHMYDGNGRNRLARIGSGASLLMSARIMLEGAYNGTATMNALLGPPLIPLSEPYRVLGFTHVRGGSESISPSVLQHQGAGAIVDWVLVELRDPNDPTQIMATRSGLLRADGWISDTDGSSPLRFFGISEGLYHIAIRHRNHLGIMTDFPTILGSAPLPMDFTTSNQATYGTSARKIIGNTYMLWAGDVNHDGVIKYTGGGNDPNDRDFILQAIGGVVPTNSIAGYMKEDVNLDGEAKYTGQFNDRDYILQNIGGVVPTNTRQAQLP